MFTYGICTFSAFIYCCPTRFLYHSLCRLIAIRRVSLVEQELPTLPEYLSLLSFFLWIRVAQCLECFVFSVVFCGLLFVFVSFDHCIVDLRFRISFFVSSIFSDVLLCHI
jgi:hypothetical protein